MFKTKSGFTLVELMIVIVVIAILAAVTIVAYNGLQDKAKNAALLSAFDATEKALRMYKIENGSYPVPTDLYNLSGDPSNPIYSACVNATLPAENGFSAGKCSTVATPGVYVESTVLDAALKTELLSLPDTHSYATSYPSSDTYRGLLYVNRPTDADDTVELRYVIKGGQTCGRGTASQFSGVTFCVLVLN